MKVLSFKYVSFSWAGIAQSVQRLATDWWVRGLGPHGSEIFRTRPDRLWGPPSHLYHAYHVFPVCNAAGAWCWPPTPSSFEVKERVELYIYSPLGPSWPVLGGGELYLYFYVSFSEFEFCHWYFAFFRGKMWSTCWVQTAPWRENAECQKDRLEYPLHHSLPPTPTIPPFAERLASVFHWRH